jgi:hypothetical protein
MLMMGMLGQGIDAMNAFIGRSGILGLAMMCCIFRFWRELGEGAWNVS